MNYTRFLVQVGQIAGDLGHYLESTFSHSHGRPQLAFDKILLPLRTKHFLQLSHFTGLTAT
jgi:hypothetical protein